MNFAQPFLMNPRELAPGKDRAPAIAIYHDRDGTLTVTATEIQITIGVDLVVVSYVGKSIDQVVSEICVASPAIYANSLNNSHLMTAGFLLYDGEATSDGGWVVRMNAHVVKYEEETRVRTLQPYPEHRLLPWYPRVDRGTVVMRRQGVDFYFEIPEYSRQEWSTYFGAPFVDVRAERAEFLTQKTLRVARAPVFWTMRNISVNVDGTPFGSSIVEDVDSAGGIIRLSSPIQAESRILVDYTYRENGLIYKDIDLNPSRDHNPGIVDQTVLLYLMPTRSSLGPLRDRGVHHTTAKTLAGAITAIPSSSEPKLVIGSYQVRPLMVLEDLQLTDTRRRGGGIHDDQVETAAGRNPESASFTDVGRYDGVPFPGSTGGIMRVRRSLLEQIPAEHIESLMGKHLSVGGSILLDFDEALE